MLMEQEAPLLFHTVFAGAVILTVAYLLHWRGHSPQKSRSSWSFILSFYRSRPTSWSSTLWCVPVPERGPSLSQWEVFAGWSEFWFSCRGFAICWITTQIKRIRPNEQRYGEEYLKKVLLIFYRINLHRAIRSPARAGRAARLSDGMLLSREVYIKPKGAFKRTRPCCLAG